jgi:hypothetical protein
MLVGAATSIIYHAENKNHQQKRGVKITLPAPLEGGTRVVDGILLYNPNWSKSSKHEDNVVFMDALVKKVTEVLVSSYYLCFNSQSDRMACLQSQKGETTTERRIRTACETYFKRMRQNYQTQLGDQENMVL